MSEVAFGAVSAAAVLVGIIAWAVMSGQRAFLSEWVLRMVVAGVAIIGVLLVMRLVLPEALRGLAVALVGIALSGVLVSLAVQYRQRLPSGQTRQLIGFAVLGVVITALGLVAVMMRAGR